MAYIGPVAEDNAALYTKDSVQVRIAKEDVGKGDLYITERYFIWRPENKVDGISIPWTCVSLHAISSEPLRAIYMQLDFRLEWPGVYEKRMHARQDQPMNGNGQHPDDREDDEDEGNVSDSSDDIEATEIHIIPQDENDINQIYYAMNHCQTMNPDPNESLSEEDEDFMEAEGEESDDAAQGDMRNLHLNDDEDERYADGPE